MILIIQPSNFDFLKDMPGWAARAFVVAYVLAFAGLIGSIAYAIYVVAS